MTAHTRFRKRFDFTKLPNDWSVSSVSTDWLGNPLILAEEGRPPYPREAASATDLYAWYKTPVVARHLVYWEGAAERSITFEQSAGVSSCLVQPFREGWVLCEIRGGRAQIYDESGALQSTLHLGDAINDMQTTPNGKTWVTYFDEGVFGIDPMSQEGVVCINSSGDVTFRYSEFAKRNGLPPVDDCYAVNVVGEEQVWLSYYSAFPLVEIRNFELAKAWRDFGCISKAFGLIEGTVIFAKCYTPQTEGSQLIRRTLADTPQEELLQPFDEAGCEIKGRFMTAGRGDRFYLRTKTSLYELISI